jgi:transcriptional regulator with XRE-family HTH domain
MPTQTVMPAERTGLHPSRDRDIKLDFGRRLQSELIKRGWNQSELARQAALHTPDSKFGRDLISGYIRGRILPSPVHMQALAKALGKTPDELLPLPSGQMETASPIQTTDLGNNRVALQIKQVVDWSIALQILQLLKGTPSAGDKSE